MLLFPDSTPKPVPGARDHVVGYGLVDGVNEVTAEFHFNSKEECQQEKIRMGELLREKYGVILATHTTLGSETSSDSPTSEG